MNNYSKEQLAEIHKLATDFTKQALENYHPDHMCFTICYPLSLYLENLGYQNTIACGSYNNDNHIKHGTTHFWLQLRDTTIVDPTIGQFNENEFRVYVGQKPDKFRSFNHKFEKWFYDLGTYDAWKNRLLGTYPLNTMPDQEIKNDLDILKLISINLNAATIVNAQPQNNQEHSVIYKEYFDCIFQVIRHYYNTKEWSQVIYPENFNSLFAKALRG